MLPGDFVFYSSNLTLKYTWSALMSPFPKGAKSLHPTIYSYGPQKKDTVLFDCVEQHQFWWQGNEKVKCINPKKYLTQKSIFWLCKMVENE